MMTQGHVRFDLLPAAATAAHAFAARAHAQQLGRRGEGFRTSGIKCGQGVVITCAQGMRNQCALKARRDQGHCEQAEPALQRQGIAAVLVLEAQAVACQQLQQTIAHGCGILGATRRRTLTDTKVVHAGADTAQVRQPVAVAKAKPGTVNLEEATITVEDCNVLGQRVDQGLHKAGLPAGHQPAQTWRDWGHAT